jgi:F-type H+-transporting ATPase subunit alpha
MVASLNQPQFKPWPHAEQVVALYAGINGHLDEVPVAQVPRFQDELREHLRGEGTVYKAIEETSDLGDDTVAKLDAELEAFKKRFNIEEDKGLVA